MDARTPGRAPSPTALLAAATLLVPLAGAGCASSGAGDVPVGASRDITTTATGRIQDMGVRAITDEQAIEGLLLESPDFAWSKLPGIFEELGIEVTHSDPARWTMGTRGARVRRIGGERPAAYLDCGSGPTAQPYANSYDVTMGLMVQLREAEEGTWVTVRVDATAKPRSVSGHALTCSTKGALERRILEMISP